MSEQAKKVYNPFKKAYWTKDNLLNDKDVAKLKSDLSDVRAEYQANKSKDGIDKKISRLGWKLTLGITFPIFGYLFFNIVGLIVAIILAALIIPSIGKK